MMASVERWNFLGGHSEKKGGKSECLPISEDVDHTCGGMYCSLQIKADRSRDHGQKAKWLKWTCQEGSTTPFTKS